MTEKEIQKIFITSGALLEGHFQLASGKHSDRYVQCAKVLQYPEHTVQLGKVLAARFSDDGVQVVVGPAVGGIVLAYELARLLGARALFMEREEGQMTLRRGFNIKPGERILAVEDVITTGGSVREVLEAAYGCGAEIVGAAALVDRSGGSTNLGVRTEKLLTLDIQTYVPHECPFCKQGLPLVQPGSKK